MSRNQNPPVLLGLLSFAGILLVLAAISSKLFGQVSAAEQSVYATGTPAAWGNILVVGFVVGALAVVVGAYWIESGR